MKAIVEHAGGLLWTEVQSPEPGPGEVRIRVHATAANRADLVQRTGLYPPPPGASPILGLECAGLIDAVGEGVRDRAIGQGVCALLAGGGYAQQVVCPATHTLPLPAGFSMVEAAAVVEVFATAWSNLFVEGALAPGERALVHAGASGVGTAAIQLCAARGNPVFATVGSAAKAARCLELGASAVAVRTDGPWGPAVKAWGGADVILDPVGGSYLASDIAALNLRGRLVIIGLMGGREAMLDLGALLVRRLTVRGSVLRSRSIAEKDAVMAGLYAEVWPLLADRTVAPVIDEVADLPVVAAVHTRMASNDTVGKVVLRVP